MADYQKSILIAEDENPLSHALRLKLEHEGFLVTTATNGEECIHLLQQQQFDVLLLDLIMPVLNGFQVLERMREMPHPPVVFVLSNLSQAEDKDRVLEMGARQFFIKSDTPLTEVVAEVRKL